MRVKLLARILTSLARSAVAQMVTTDSHPSERNYDRKDDAMSLLIPGTMRAKSVVLMLAVSLAASLSLLGVPSASATQVVDASGVTASPAESDNPCSYLMLRVTNNSVQTVWTRFYEVRNGVRTDYNILTKLGPGESYTMNSDGERYFSHALGATAGTYGVGPTGPGWNDLGATEFVTPPGCPPMIAAAKLTRRTKSVSKEARPIVWFKADAYSTDIGYQVVGKSKRIKWDYLARYKSEGVGAMHGPRMKPGQRLKIKFFSRNRDDAGVLTDPVYIGKKKFKRTRR